MKQTGPAYLRLYERLRQEIIDGSWPFGARMPSKRQLSEEEGVSVVTVEHAYALLCDEGYLESRERSGYFVLFRETDGFLPPDTARPLPLPAAEGARPDFPFSVLARTMRRVLSEYQEGLMERSPNRGTEPVRRAIARYLGRSRGIHVSPEQIWIGAGAEYLYGLIVQALGRKKIYAVEDPSYEKIRRVYAAHGAVCRLLPLGPDGIRSEALSDTDAAVLHITPYRSYPSNVTASAAKRREYVRWAERGDRYVVEDDFTSELAASAKPEETVFSLAERGNVIYLNTFTRTVSPSFRVGYMVLPRALLPLFADRVGFYSCTVPTFEQYVLAALMDSGDLERHINRIRRRERRGQTEK